jgi:hypothetical protein
MANDVRDQWIFDVLGVDVEAAADWGGKLTPIWTGAKARVDQGFDALQRALKAIDDPDVQQLADFGLNGVTNRESVNLMAALMDADSGRGTDKLVVAIDRFRSFLDGSLIVDLLEDNPLGVVVPLRAQLGSALDIIASKIAA